MPRSLLLTRKWWRSRRCAEDSEGDHAGRAAETVEVMREALADLDRVAAEFEAMKRENKELREENEGLRKRLGE